MTRDANQSTGSSATARINSQLNRGLPNQRAAQALIAEVIATTTIKSSASFAFKLKGVAQAPLGGRRLNRSRRRYKA